MNLRRVGALVKKESYQIVRDPSSIIIAFVLPFVLLFIFGNGINLDTTRINIGIAMEGHGTDADRLAAAFISSKFLNAHTANDRRELIPELDAGRIRGIIIIPQDFSAKSALESESAVIQVIADGSEPNTASFVHSYASGIWQTWLLQYAQENGLEIRMPLAAEPRFLFNPELKSRNFLLPGSIAIIMTLIGTMLTSLVVAREWERGTMEAMMAKPVTVPEIILGKLIPYFILGMGSMALCVFVSVFLYGVPFRGSFMVLTGVSAVFLLASLGQGLLISTLARNQFVAAQIALLSAFLPAFMLSGFIFEISSMPAAIRGLTYLFAARYFVTVLQTLFLAGNVRSLLIANTAAIAAVASVFFIIIAAKTKKTLD
ncbi:ABC transporter permease [Geovibrio thiophilus]|uniref:ABC transporter permease n=1 Tax=Geovibrio thiophilus TaxID=139438 RepID=A0A410K0T0_9BACT|nr:ABC transporter permease [Geovibrio thiophilus]QAR33992.1 ABC transporter permease [Geovibrio thiophilus]